MHLPSEFHETLDNYKRKLIAWMAHHARKTYLNTYVQVSLNELDHEGAVCIVDYKMKILPQTAQCVIKTQPVKIGTILSTKDKRIFYDGWPVQ